jgi:hypothetical protein
MSTMLRKHGDCSQAESTGAWVAIRILDAGCWILDVGYSPLLAFSPNGRLAFLSSLTPND